MTLSTSDPRGENMTDKLQRIAANIIDKVESAIRKTHPEVDEIASKCEGNTLLHGEAYYTLEDSIAETLRQIHDI